MRLNPKKCTFTVKADKFLGFYLTKRGIKANPNKCESVIKMNAPYAKKEMIKLNEILAT